MPPSSSQFFHEGFAPGSTRKPGQGSCPRSGPALAPMTCATGPCGRRGWTLGMGGRSQLWWHRPCDSGPSPPETPGTPDCGLQAGQGLLQVVGLTSLRGRGMLLGLPPSRAEPQRWQGRAGGRGQCLWGSGRRLLGWCGHRVCSWVTSRPAAPGQRRQVPSREQQIPRGLGCSPRAPRPALRPGWECIEESGETGARQAQTAGPRPPACTLRPQSRAARETRGQGRAPPSLPASSLQLPKGDSSSCPPTAGAGRKPASGTRGQPPAGEGGHRWRILAI